MEVDGVLPLGGRKAPFLCLNKGSYKMQLKTEDEIKDRDEYKEEFICTKNLAEERGIENWCRCPFCSQALKSESKEGICERR